MGNLFYRFSGTGLLNSDGNQTVQREGWWGGGTLYEEEEDDPSYTEAKIILSCQEQEADHCRKTEIH